MADREKKGVRQRYKNLNISRKKGFLEEIKSIFHSFLKGYKKIADISFNEKCACVYVLGKLVCQIRAGDVMVGGTV